MTATTIPVIVSRSPNAAATKGIVSKAAEAVREVIDVDVDKLKTNLTELIGKVGAVVDAAQDAAGAFKLEEVSVGVEISAEGGVSLIGSATVGATASITLTFKRA